MGVNCGICCKNISSEPNLGMTKLESPKEDLVTPTENGNTLTQIKRRYKKRNVLSIVGSMI